MKVKKVNRYYCEFCKKSGGHAGAMRKHEKHCTMNPDRECRMCKMINMAQPDMKKLLALFPPMEQFEVERKAVLRDGYNSSNIDLDDYPGYTEAVEKAFEQLKEETNGCPACILAVLRQTGTFIGIPYDFKLESNRFFKEYNDARYSEQEEIERHIIF